MVRRAPSGTTDCRHRAAVPPHRRFDAARGAFVAHRYPEVLQRLEAYRREFPSGQLAPDAEALSIEALASAGNRSEAARRAQRFLTHYPKNAHTARVAAVASP